jgi:hypothetical protein
VSAKEAAEKSAKESRIKHPKAIIFRKTLIYESFTLEAY